MTLARSVQDLKTPSVLNSEEWALRVRLAAAYRVAAHLGWTESIYGHITLRVPGPERHFLINPWGLRFDEVTASSLVKINADGAVVGDSAYGVNRAGFTIHSAIHEARDNAHCVFHIHTTAGMAVAAQADGLLPVSMPATGFYQRVAYHDYEGPSLKLDERARLVASLGDKNVLILRTHGLLTCGHTTEEAFIRMFRLQRACEIQIAALGKSRIRRHAFNRTVGNFFAKLKEFKAVVCAPRHQFSMKNPNRRPIRRNAFNRTVGNRLSRSRSSDR